jgi:ribulose-5-phosphate 4-epimerase/fuculose-1-phosphate aldolase
MGWDELIYNHISYRVPGEPHAFLINPFGLRYGEVTASNLVKIDIDGKLLAPSRWEINQFGFQPHSIIHRKVPDAHCVLHTHTTAGVAVSCLEEGLPLTNMYSIPLASDLGYHDFEGPTSSAEEGPRMVANLGNRHCLILRNHGLLTVGLTIPAAFLRMWQLQRACEIHLAVTGAGKLRYLSPEACREYLSAGQSKLPPETMGQIDFAALVRKLDEVDKSWRN